MQPRTPIADAYLKIALSVPWQIFGTLTFDRAEKSLERLPPGSRHRRRHRARRATPERAAAAWKVLTERVARTLHIDVDDLLYLRAFERHSDGEIHVHFAMASPVGGRPLACADVLDRWIGPDSGNPKFGRAKVEAFDPDQAFEGNDYIVSEAAVGVDIEYSRGVAKLRGDIP